MPLKSPRPCLRAGARRIHSRPASIAARVAAFVVPLAGCSGGVLDPQGPVGSADTQILLNSVGIMLCIVIPTILGVLAFAWWFRASNTRARYRPDFVYSGRVELVVWGIPLLVILFLSGVIWIGSHELDPFQPVESQAKPLNVQVVSLDWKWLFIYPDQGIASVNDLVVPSGTPVHFTLTSSTVMNAFFVPQLGSMIAVMPGMRSEVHLEASHPGDYYGESSQFSGDGFSGMHFTAHAVPADQFARWVAMARQAGPALDPTAYAALSRESQDVQPFTYRAVTPNLFQAVVSRELPETEGPPGSSAPREVRPRGAH